LFVLKLKVFYNYIISMNKLRLFFLILLYSASFSNNKALAQQKNTDSVLLHQTTANMAGAFYKTIGDRSRLYNGPAVDPYDFRSATNANFKDTAAFNNGNVNYDGILYTNVPLIYNINRDLLISRIINGFATYSLLSDRVAEFDLLGHHFIRLPADSLNKLNEAGFYDQLYNNKLLLLARRTKEIEQEAISRGVGKFFVEKTSYFLKKGRTYYSVNSQGKFLDVLKDKKKELKQYIKDNKLKFGDNPERVMTMLAAYYDHLTN